MAIIDTLMNQIIAKSVLAHHEFKDLWLREFLNVNDELGIVSLFDGLHQNSLFVDVLFFLLFLLQKEHCLVLLVSHLLLG